jgi:hypothetical protein
MRRPIARFAALGFATVLALAACGSDNSNSTPQTTPTTTATTTATTVAGQGSAQLCQARDALTTSMKDLGSIDVVKNGTAAITDALTTIKKNLADVKAAASAQLQPQVTAFENALNQLQTAVANPSASGVVTALKDVTTTGTTLLTGLAGLKCS